MFDTGHVCVIGKTQSGKTYFIKDMLKDFIDKGEVKPEHIVIFCDKNSKYQWCNSFSYCTDFSNDTLVKFERDVNKCKANGDNVIVVFDDFNNNVNTQANKHFHKIFTLGRHLGIRVIATAHTPASIGKIPRNMFNYVVLFISPREKEQLDDIAHIYYGGSTNELRKIVKDRKDRYTAVVLDLVNDKFFYHKAGETQSCNITGQKNIQNNGLYHDESTTEINIQNNNNNVELNQMINVANTRNKIAVLNFIQSERINELKRLNETRDLIYKRFLLPEDKARIVLLLNFFLGTNKVNLNNYFKYAKVFMKHYFPEAQIIEPSHLENLIQMDIVPDKYKKYYSSFVTGMQIWKALM
jgi:hypothetical protein